MELEEQVCSLELAEKLKELGVKQESLIYWEKCPSKGSAFSLSYAEWHDNWTGEFEDCHMLKSQDNYSAFTVAELGEMLPLWWDSGKREDEDYICRVFKKNITNTVSSFGETEADARAKMLIYLIENKFIDLKGE